MKNILKNEVYIIPSKGAVEEDILYAPLTRSFAISDSIRNISEIPKDWYDDATNTSNIPDFILASWENPKQNKIRIRLNITNSCNLSCDYCSVKAKKNGENLSLNDAKRAVDYFFDMAIEDGIDLVEITFSGGEPTLDPQYLQDVVEYADRQSHEKNVKLVTKLITNGVFNYEKLSSVLNMMNGIQVSWDGFIDNSPRYKNNHTAELVWENIGKMTEEGIKVNIVTVVSPFNQKKLEEIVDELLSTYNISSLFLSLQDDVGKAKEIHEQLDYKEIENAYMKIWKKYRDSGININLTGTDIHAVSMYPCAVPSPNYSISPTGEIHSCTIVFNEKNDFSDFTLIGKISSDKIHLNFQKILEQTKINVFNMLDCKDCFAKWHCRGGCPYASESNKNSQRCEMIKNIIQKKLYTIISE